MWRFGKTQTVCWRFTVAEQSNDTQHRATTHSTEQRHTSQSNNTQHSPIWSQINTCAIAKKCRCHFFCKFSAPNDQQQGKGNFLFDLFFNSIFSLTLLLLRSPNLFSLPHTPYILYTMLSLCTSCTIS